MTLAALHLIRAAFGAGDYPLPDESIEVCERGRVISHVGLFWREIRLEDHGPLLIGGIGLVCTDPGWRRLGLATALLETARRRSALHGRPHLGLFAGDHEAALYRTLGYQPTNAEHFYTFPPVGRVQAMSERW